MTTSHAATGQHKDPRDRRGAPTAQTEGQGSLQVVAVAPQSEGPTVSQHVFRGVFGRLPQGVTVVTTQGPQGPCGMTASSVTSLSLEPPLALVCFSNASRTLAVVSETRRFALNVLKLHQQEPSSAFAHRRDDSDRFTRFAFHMRHGIPLLDDTLAWAVCRLEGLVRAGDHTIAIGLVQAAGHDDGEPLLWHQGTYRSLAA